MAPLEGFDCAGKGPEINNNVPLLTDKSEQEREPARADAQPEVEDLGQKLLADHSLRPGDAVEEEAKKRVSKGRQLVWLNIILIPLFHFVSLYAILVYITYPKWQSWVWGFFLGGAGGFGVTGGAHRLWSHRSYKAKLPLRIILALCYSVAGQNTIYEWVRDHRVHHKFTETDADPHNVKRGFFFAHVGWLMQKKHPDVLRQGRKVDLSDVLADPVVQWHQKYFMPLKLLLCFIVPVVVPRYCWDEDWLIAILGIAFVRYVLLLNFTWLVNSAAHMFGNKPYDRRINPTQNLAVSLVAMGEGWHNYHHVFPWDYKASEFSYYFNITTFWIDQFAKLGWAYDLKAASPEMVTRVVSRHGDGSHHSSGRSDHDDHHHEEVTFEEYLRLMKEDDNLTGVQDLHNEEDVTRKRTEDVGLQNLHNEQDMTIRKRTDVMFRKASVNC